MKTIDHFALTAELLPIALEAGDIIMRYVRDGFDPVLKTDGSPVTDADKDAEDHIIRALDNLDLSYPIIGEELCAAGKAPKLESETYWLVDALDGTRSFIKGKPEFSVNIALIHQGAPKLGVIAAPALDLLYCGAEGHGAFKGDISTTAIDQMQQIRVRSMPSQGVTLTMNSTAPKIERIERYLNGLKVNDILKSASSLKICYIAEGKADLYPRFGETSEWDTAAGQAILNAAGGKIINLETGETLIYGDKPDHFNNPHFMALSEDLYRHWK